MGATFPEVAPAPKSLGVDSLRAVSRTVNLKLIALVQAEVSFPEVYDPLRLDLES